MNKRITGQIAESWWRKIFSEFFPFFSGQLIKYENVKTKAIPDEDNNLSAQAQDKDLREIQTKNRCEKTQPRCGFVKLRFQRRILIAKAYLFPRNSHGLTRRTRAKIRGLEKIRGSEKRLSWGGETSPLKFIKFVMLSSLYVFFLVTQNGKAFVSKHSDLGFGTGGWTNELIFAHHRWNSYGQKKVGDDLVTS